MKIGEVLRKLRKEKGVATRKLSKLSGMSETQILDIEFSRRNYTIQNLMKYLDALNLILEIKNPDK